MKYREKWTFFYRSADPEIRRKREEKNTEEIKPD